MTLNETPLPYGELAPEFCLKAADGQIVTRSQFRGKKALALIFIQPTPELFDDLFPAIAADTAEYAELGALVLGIVQTSPEELTKIAAWEKLPFPLLADPDGAAWKAYTGLTNNSGYAVFVLDIYGGVDAQQVADCYEALPDATKILRWTRAAQYKCSI